MPRVLPAVTLTLLGCRPPAYVQPTPEQPHAILKLRHVVHQKGGASYASSVWVGRFAVDERTLGDEQAESSSIHLRVRPNPDAFMVRGRSYHMEYKTVTRYRSEQESYSCPQQKCSGGFGTTPRSCYTAYNTCTRSRQVPYQTQEWVPVTNDQCEAAFPFAPQAQKTYLLQFDYLGENQCKLSCFAQVANPAGDFTLTPCAPVVLPAE